MSFPTFADGNELTAAQLNAICTNTVDITTATPQTVTSPLTIGGVATTTLSASGLSKFTGAEGHNDTTITSGSTYTVAANDFVISVYKTVAGPITITLPSAPTYNRWLIVMDVKGDCGTNNITVSGAQQINGQASFVLNQNYASLTLKYSTVASMWSVV